MDPRLLTAVAAGKLSGFLSRRLHLGGGTTFPGTVARRIDGQLLTKLSARLGRGSLVVTGTNGKTTTTRLVANIVTAAGWSPVHNRAGANLLNGLATALVAHAAPTRTGRSPAPDGAGAVGLFEVDEAVFPAAVLSLQPRAVVLTNLFRDQLDRYGEIDHLAHLWRGALARCGPATTAILNADDPVVAAIGRGLAGPVIYYGIEDARHSLDAPEHAADSKVCPECGAPYDYRAVYYGHLGLYRCPRGHVERPAAHVAAETVALRGADGAELTIRLPAGPAGDAPDGAADGASSQTLSLAVPLSGLYNVYNVLAAITAARALGADVPAIGRGVEGFAAAFGRLERIVVRERAVVLALVKNPVGFNQVLRTLFASPGASPGTDGGEKRPPALILINDNFADGTDISWLWDVDFEWLRGRVRGVICGGTRGEDLRVRLKYAGLPVEQLRHVGDPAAAIDAAIAAAEPGETLYILPSYTAMLAVRQVLAQRGLVRGFWEN